MPFTKILNSGDISGFELLSMMGRQGEYVKTVDPICWDKVFLRREENFFNSTRFIKSTYVLIAYDF